MFPFPPQYVHLTMPGVGVSSSSPRPATAQTEQGFRPEPLQVEQVLNS